MFHVLYLLLTLGGVLSLVRYAWTDSRLTARTDSYSKSAEDGVSLYREWEEYEPSSWSDNTSDYSNPTLSRLDKFLKTTTTRNATFDELDDAHLSYYGIDPGGFTRVQAVLKEKYRTSLSENPASGIFECDIYISTEQGVLAVAQADYGVVAKVLGMHPKVAVADVTWWLWVSRLQAEERKKHRLKRLFRLKVDYSKLDYSGINSIGITNIEDTVTASIIYQLMREQLAENEDLPEAILTYRPDDPDMFGNPFWVLLGTPVGQAIIEMLTLYKSALRSRALVSLTVIRDGFPSGKGLRSKEGPWLRAEFHMLAFIQPST